MKDLWELAITIREFENLLFNLLAEKKIHGTIHTCIGQEWSGIAVSKYLTEKNDAVFSNHRCHGHYISFCNDTYGLLAEIIGKQDGTNHGVGGSQHVGKNNFYSNGIQGGMTPIAAGYAFANKLANNNGISVVYVGDGTFGEGIIYETLNICSLWEIPILFVVENNEYAQSTKRASAMAGSIEKRAAAFDIKYLRASTKDINDLLDKSKDAITFCRTNKKPIIFEINTYRLVPHSKGDDFRDKEEIEQHRLDDPTTKYSIENKDSYNEISANARKKLSDMVSEIEKSDLSNYTPNQELCKNNKCEWFKYEQDSKRERYNELIYKSLLLNFETNKSIVMLGEDIKYPYGGAFKATKNLSALYSDRVFNTPISESAIVGIATGMALSGSNLPIVEIMFGDFSTLIVDQLVNHACKFKDIYGIDIPMIIRTPMGGRRGYGPTHSQSLEKLFYGIYGLDILALNPRYSPMNVFNTLFSKISKPTLVIENKVLTTQVINKSQYNDFTIEISNEEFPTIKLSCKHKLDLTIFCYGEMLNEVEKSITELYESYDIGCQVICPTQIQPMNIYPILESVNKTKRLLTVEEGSCVGGVGSDVIARIVKNVSIEICDKIGYSGIIPASINNENELLPSSKNIIERAVKLCKK